MSTDWEAIARKLARWLAEEQYSRTEDIESMQDTHLNAAAMSVGESVQVERMMDEQYQSCVDFVRRRVLGK